MDTVSGKVVNLHQGLHDCEVDENNTLDTHVYMFSLGEEHIQLNLPVNAELHDGDRVRVAGTSNTTGFYAFACKNLSTGWTSPEPNRRVLFTMASMLIFIGVLIGAGVFTLITIALLNAGVPAGFSAVISALSFIFPLLIINLALKIIKSATMSYDCWRNVSNI